jgi:hypothetical protein
VVGVAFVLLGLRIGVMLGSDEELAPASEPAAPGHAPALRAAG